MTKKLVLVYIHGATATSASFSYIRERLQWDNEILLDYDCKNGFKNNLASMIEQLTGLDNLFFISHSLGGIYALHLANHFTDHTLGGVSLSTPYGGSREADYLRIFLPCNRLLRDVGPRSFPMSTIDDMQLPKIWTNIVTNKNNGLWRTEPNDGIVTRASMCYRNDMELIDIALNHYEVLLSSEVVDIIEERIKKHPLN